MSLLKRLRVELTGPAVIGPSVSTYYFSESATGMTADLAAFYDAISDFFPSSLTFNIPAGGDVIEDQTGEIQESWSDGSFSAVSGSFTGEWVNGVGFRTVWETNARNRGRRVRGTTFHVPAGVNIYADGQVLQAVRSDVAASATTFMNATNGGLYIWSRPEKDKENGGSNVVIAAGCPATITTLRSRRV